MRAGKPSSRGSGSCTATSEPALRLRARECRGKTYDRELPTMAREIEIEVRDVGEAIVAALAYGGVDHLFFSSGTELAFYQEAIAKARGPRPPRPPPAPHNPPSA